jgi:hypothetical protein
MLFHSSAISICSARVRDRRLGRAIGSVLFRLSGNVTSSGSERPADLMIAVPSCFVGLLLRLQGDDSLIFGYDLQVIVDLLDHKERGVHRLKSERSVLFCWSFAVSDRNAGTDSWYLNGPIERRRLQVADRSISRPDQETTCAGMRGRRHRSPPGGE